MLNNPNHGHRRPEWLAGQILAEACIGMSLLVLLWIFFSFTTYMANNRIRTAMAARDAAWLKANGEDPTGSVPGAFYSSADASLAAASAGTEFTLALAIPTPFAAGQAWSNSVSFGMAKGDLAGTTRYPFLLLNTHVPFMPDSLMDNFLSVATICAWPADTANTFTSLIDAIPGGSGVSIPTSF